ncbi:MAG: hypothetical protein Sylvanvirus10_29 [Sylvanvirus sp.]|uniref:Uncharacterized protein n=1 Tax=Sylvanvirus sp. TaxID=2487774 RepID=A0A3G5AHY5_9VIRU|nr:MAG: hypothetical protein Sylvanvirus10_29 [Sylvanvirus sp.]
MSDNIEFSFMKRVGTCFWTFVEGSVCCTINVTSCCAISICLCPWWFIKGLCQCENQNSGPGIYYANAILVPGRWNEDICECPEYCFSTCSANISVFLWSRNIGSLCHPYRFARCCQFCCRYCCCCLSGSKPVSQEMK